MRDVNRTRLPPNARGVVHHVKSDFKAVQYYETSLVPCTYCYSWNHLTSNYLNGDQVNQADEYEAPPFRNNNA